MNKQRDVSSAAFAALALVALLATASGCATKGFVQSEVAQSKAYTDSRFGEAKQGVDRAQSRADEAFDKATLAERLASGHLAYEEVSSHRVHFAFDDYQLGTEAQQVLDELGGRLGSYPGYVLEIRGYADATGADRYNFRLGRERAESVQRYMMTRFSVPAGRVAIVSFGEEEPLAENDSSSGREQNRRVQVRLLDAQRAQGEPVAGGEW
jgi:outer membrane protein OmpA-like peptidoglycan-associated protein